MLATNIYSDQYAYNHSLICLRCCISRRVVFCPEWLMPLRNTQIQIIQRMQKVTSGPFLSIYTFCSIK